MGVRLGLAFCALIGAYLLLFNQEQPMPLSDDTASVASEPTAESANAASRVEASPEEIAEGLASKRPERIESEKWRGQLVAPASQQFDGIHIWFWPNTIERGADWRTAEGVFQTRSDSTGRFDIPEACQSDVPYSCAAVGGGLVSESVVPVTRAELLELPLEQLLGLRVRVVTREGGAPEVGVEVVAENAYGTRSGPAFKQPFHKLDLPRELLVAEGIPAMDSGFQSDYSWNVVVACPIQVETQSHHDNHCYFGVVLPGYHAFAQQLPLQPIHTGRLHDFECVVHPIADGWTEVELRSERMLSDETRELIASATLSSVELLFDPLESDEHAFSIQLPSFERAAGAAPLRLPNGEYEIYGEASFGTAELIIPGPGENSSWKLDGNPFVLPLPTEKISALQLQPLLPGAEVANATYFRLRTLYHDDYISEIGRIEAPFILDGLVAGEWRLEFSPTREGFQTGIDAHYVNLVVPPGLGELIALPALK